MNFLDSLPSLNDRPRMAVPKAGLPGPLAKKAKAKDKADKDDAFRAAIWKRDGGKSMATGKPLVKSGTMSWQELGEIDHAINRSTAPDRVYDLSNGLLLSKEENRLKKVRCPKAVEFFMFEIHGPDDRAKVQTFIWRDVEGKEIRRSVG